MLAGLGAGGLPWGVIAKVSQSDICSKWFINEISTWTRLESAFCDFSNGGENKNRSERYGAQRLNSSVVSRACEGP